MAERGLEYNEPKYIDQDPANEGNFATWDEHIKPYAEQVIAAIRAIDPDKKANHRQKSSRYFIMPLKHLFALRYRFNKLFSGHCIQNFFYLTRSFSIS